MDSPKDPVDPKSLLLPTKEVHTSDSAQRINAGELLKQEQSATLAKPTEGGAPDRDGGRPRLSPAGEKPYPDSVGSTASIVQPLQTYQHDIESLVEKKDVSVVSIAAAEANKRAQEKLQAAPDTGTAPFFTRAAMIGGGIILLALAGGIVAYIATRPTTVAVVPLNTEAPFITVDDTVAVPISTTDTHSKMIQTLTDAQGSVQISLGLVERLYVTVATTSNTQAMLPAKDFLALLAPHAPQTLLRTLGQDYLLAVHNYDENVPILMLHTDSYETAYAGMLAWEPYMQDDLLPLFKRTVPVHINQPQVQQPTQPTSTSSDLVSQIPTSPYQAGNFVDRIVINHDTRLVQNQYGDILLLWTFLDRNTIVITTSEATLREVISRVTNPATQSLPQ